jgi:uncharacterized membrane-anchored protein YitT (DUF2179 family)
MGSYIDRGFSCDAITIIVGSVIFAVGLNCFEIPNGLAAGGATGLATIAAELCRRSGLPGLPIGMQVLALNALLMVAVIREGGLRYAARSIVGMVASALATDLLAGSLPVLGNGDLLLCALWGGAVCGLGLGRGCTELLARGGYTGIERPVLMVVLTRPEMADLRHIVAEVDPRATVIVGKIHEASYNEF